jgi:hypothetical protein
MPFSWCGTNTPSVSAFSSVRHVRVQSRYPRQSFLHLGNVRVKETLNPPCSIKHGRRCRGNRRLQDAFSVASMGWDLSLKQGRRMAKFKICEQIDSP